MVPTAFGAGEDEFMTQAHAMTWALGYRHLLVEMGFADMVNGPWKVVGDNAHRQFGPIGQRPNWEVHFGTIS